MIIVASHCHIKYTYGRAPATMMKLQLKGLELYHFDQRFHKYYENYRLLIVLFGKLIIIKFQKGQLVICSSDIIYTIAYRNETILPHCIMLPAICVVQNKKGNSVTPL